MKAARGDVEVVGDASGAVISNFREEAAIHLDGDMLRWLHTAALPAILTTDPVPSGAPETLVGQTSIDELTGGEL